MKRLLSYLTIMLLLSACAGPEVVKKPVNKPESSQQNQENAKTENEEDKDELLNLIQKAEESENNDENKIENATFEAIDPKKTEEVKTSEKEAVKDDVNRREYIKKDDDAVKEKKDDPNTDKLLNQITTLKDQLKNKEDKITSLSNENSNLKAQEPKQVSVVLAEKISDEEYKMKYDEAYQLLLSKNYDVAISIFESLIVSNSSNSLADNAQYWIGEAHFSQRKFSQAILDFEKVFTFAKSNKDEDSQFKIGLCYYLLKDYENSKIELNRFISKYPNSRNVNRANTILNKI